MKTTNKDIEINVLILREETNGKWIKYFNRKDNYLTTKELLQIWKEQQPKTLYYE